MDQVTEVIKLEGLLISPSVTNPVTNWIWVDKYPSSTKDQKRPINTLRHYN